MKTIWNERYQNEDFQYGKSPNDFFKSAIKNIKPGKILIPAAGEGRDAVYAAKLGWNVEAFDLSEMAKEKAIILSKDNKVEISFEVADVQSINYPENSFDVIAPIFFHLPEQLRKDFHLKCIKWLKAGGKIILEAFTKNQIKNTSGGPKDLNLLYSKEEIAEDFKELKIELLQETSRNLNEGPLHQGKADLLQFIGTKI